MSNIDLDKIESIKLTVQETTQKPPSWLKATVLPYVFGAWVPYWFDIIPTVDTAVSITIVMLFLGLSRNLDWY